MATVASQEPAMSQRYAAGLFDRLTASGRAHDGGAGWSLEQLEDAVARDLEDLFNTRAALQDSVLEACPEVARSATACSTLPACA
jgi:type VI secretion system protein ImpF